MSAIGLGTFLSSYSAIFATTPAARSIDPCADGGRNARLQPTPARPLTGVGAVGSSGVAGDPGSAGETSLTG
jgi:hypothetical protein